MSIKKKILMLILCGIWSVMFGYGLGMIFGLYGCL